MNWLWKDFTPLFEPSCLALSYSSSHDVFNLINPSNAPFAPSIKNSKNSDTAPLPFPIDKTKLSYVLDNFSVLPWRVLLLIIACSSAVPTSPIFEVRSFNLSVCSRIFRAATTFSKPNALSNFPLSASNGFNASNFSWIGIDLSFNISNETPKSFIAFWASFGNASGAEILSRTFLKAVPASAPFIPFSANNWIKAVLSFMFILELRATAPNFSNASVVCGISAEPYLAPFASASTNIAAWLASAPNWFIASVKAVAASGISIPAAFANVRVASVTWFSAFTLSNSSGFAEPINL